MGTQFGFRRPAIWAVLVIGSAAALTLLVVDLFKEKPEVSVTGPMSGVCCIRFTADGKLLATGSWPESAALIFWKPETGGEAQRLEGPPGFAGRFAFSPDGQFIATGGWDHRVRVWDKFLGKQVFTLDAHRGEINSVVWSHDGSLIASACGGGLVLLWDPSGMLITTLEDVDFAILDLCLSKDGRLLAAVCADNSVFVWDLFQKKRIARLGGHSRSTTCVAFSADVTLLVTGGQTGGGTRRKVQVGEIIVWNLKGDGFERSITIDGIESVQSLAFAPCCRTLASGGSDGRVFLWDTQTGEQKGRFADHRGMVMSLDFSPDGKKLASGGAIGNYPGEIRVWDVTRYVKHDSK